tara:strand:- start:1240 stop:1473 length:234 start_codon:yes stop_codon:yes gene_type:complete
MVKVKVWKTSQNKNSFRTPLGELDYIKEEPKVGKSLFIGSSSHESGGIITSGVLKIETMPQGYIVITENSVYHIERV